MTEDPPQEAQQERYVVELLASLDADEAGAVAQRAAPQLGQKVERVQRLLEGDPGPITKPLEGRLARGVAEVLRRAGAQVSVARPGDERSALLSSPSWPAPVTERPTPSLTPTIGPEERRERAARDAGPAPAEAGAQPDVAPVPADVERAAPSIDESARRAAGGEEPDAADADAVDAADDAAPRPEAVPASAPAEEPAPAAAATPSPAPAAEVVPDDARAPDERTSEPETEPGGVPAAPVGSDRRSAEEAGNDADLDDLDRFESDDGADDGADDGWSGEDWNGAETTGEAAAAAAPAEGEGTPDGEQGTIRAEEGGDPSGPARALTPPATTEAERRTAAPLASRRVEDSGTGADAAAEERDEAEPPRDFDWGPSRWTQLRRALLLLVLLVAIVVLVLLQLNRASPASARSPDYGAGLGAYRQGDFGAAIRAWEGAATGGNPRAMYMLGYMAERGQGQPWSNRRAAGWYRQAAERGLPEAQLALGSLYERGLGVVRSDAQAARWYALAAGQGLPEAQLRYARALFEGRGVARDYDAAFAWFERAAAAGLPEARAMLAFRDWRAVP